MPIGVKVSTAVMALSMAAVTILRMASLCRLADGTTFFMMFSSVRVLLGYPTIPGMGNRENGDASASCADGGAPRLHYIACGADCKGQGPKNGRQPLAPARLPRPRRPQKPKVMGHSTPPVSAIHR